MKTAETSLTPPTSGPAVPSVTRGAVMCTRSVPEARPAPPHPSFPRNRRVKRSTSRHGRPIRHSRESGNPGVLEGSLRGVSPPHPAWIPAFAGMTISGACASLGWRFDTACFAGMRRGSGNDGFLAHCHHRVNDADVGSKFDRPRAQVLRSTARQYQPGGAHAVGHGTR